MPISNNFLNPERILRDELKLQAGDKVADLGCGGAAHFTQAAAKIVTSTGQVHAVDVLKKVLTAVEGRAKIDSLTNITTHWSDLERYGALKIHDGSLDKAILANSLFQTTHHDEVIKEAARLLKPGGKLLIIDWLPGRFFVGPPAEKKISIDEARQAAAQAGLTEIKEFQPSEHHYGLIFTK